MAYKLATAFVDIVARMGGLDKSIATVESRMRGVLNSLQSFGGSLGITIGISGAVVAINRFIASATEAQFAEARLGAVIKATGEAAGFTKDDILDLAREMAKKSVLGEDIISAAAAKMLTFKKVTGDTFKTAMTLSADLAATGFGSIEAASVQMAKALEDPVRGIGALRRAGVSFTEQEKAKIKALVKSNKLLAAQTIILDAVRTQVGGAAEALAKTPAGQWMQIKNLIGEVGEEFGKRILPAVVQFGRMALGITEGLLAAYDAAVRFNAVLGGWPAKLTIVVGLMHQLPNIIGLMRLATAKLISTIIAGQLFTGWGAILVAVGAIAVAIYEVTRYLAGIPAIQEAWAAGMKKLLYAWEVIKATVRTVGEAILKELKPVLDWMGVNFTGAFSAMQEGIVGVITKGIAFFAELIADAAEWIYVIVTRWNTALDLVLTSLRFLGAYIYDVISKNASHAFGYFSGRAIKALMDFSLKLAGYTAQWAVAVMQFGQWFVPQAIKWVIIFGQAMVDTIRQIPFWIATALAKGEIELQKFGLALAAKMATATAAAQKAAVAEFAKVTAGLSEGLAEQEFKLDLEMGEDAKKRLEEMKFLIDLLNEAKADFAKERDAFFAAPPEPPKMPDMPKQQVEQTIALDIKGGLMGVADAWNKIQEAMLARDDDTGERTAGALETGVGLWEKQEEHLAGIGNTLTKMGAGAIA